MNAYADTGFVVTLYKLGTRSLDLMHAAAALLLGSETFLSFDERQRKAAKSEGLKVKPSVTEPTTA